MNHNTITVELLQCRLHYLHKKFILYIYMVLENGQCMYICMYIGSIVVVLFVIWYCMYVCMYVCMYACISSLPMMARMRGWEADCHQLLSYCGYCLSYCDWC